MKKKLFISIKHDLIIERDMPETRRKRFLKKTWISRKLLFFPHIDQAPFIIYADLECLIEKIGGSKNNPKNSSTSKLGEHIPSGFSMSIIWSFRGIKN